MLVDEFLDGGHIAELDLAGQLLELQQVWIHVAQQSASTTILNTPSW